MKSVYLMLNDKRIREGRKRYLLYTTHKHIHNKIKEEILMTITVLICVFGHMFIPGIHNFSSTTHSANSWSWLSVVATQTNS